MTGLGSLSRVLLFACIALGGACGGEPEPSFGDPGDIAGRKLGGNTSGPSTSSSGDGGSTSSSGGADPFSPEPAAPTTTAKAAHKAKGQPDPVPTLACGSCHNGTTAPAWAIAGYIEKKGGGGAKDAIVVVVDGATRVAAKADADGFFWVAGTPVTKGNASAKLTKIGKMLTPLAAGGGNCSASACHTPTGAGSTMSIE